jgi:hypothetical protein
MTEFTFPPHKTKIRHFIDTLYSHVLGIIIWVENKLSTKRLPWDSNQMWTMREMAMLAKSVGAANLLKVAKDSDMPYEIRQALAKYKK